MDREKIEFLGVCHYPLTGLSKYELRYQDGREKRYICPSSYIDNVDLQPSYKLNDISDDDALGISLRFLNDNVDEFSNKVYLRDKKTDEIIEEHGFFEGFKLVRFRNGEYGYICESDNEILPYRFDVATDFNEQGLAMVGKNEFVNFIDTKFQCFKYNVDEDNIIDYYAAIKSKSFKDLFPLRKVFINDEMFGFDMITNYISRNSSLALIGYNYGNFSVAIDSCGNLIKTKNYFTLEEDDNIPCNAGRVSLFDDFMIVYDGPDEEKPRVYLPNGTFLTLSDIYSFSHDFNIEDILRDESMNKRTIDDMPASQKLANHDYALGASGNWISYEWVSRTEYVRRVTEKGKKNLFSMPYGYETQEDVKRIRHIYPKKKN